MLAGVRARSCAWRAFRTGCLAPSSLRYWPACQRRSIATECIRNIGIIAHIDAGKTTLTERILHLTRAQTLSGLEPPKPQASYTAPGDVDTGSTVTDFLEEERERGITIQSAAVGPVWWTNARHDTQLPVQRHGNSMATSSVAITLVDTPGHVDFGIEVERTVRVVDGAVVVLDGVEGVEPQSENVWRQTKRYGVHAHLFFVNKLDREGSSVGRSIRSIIDKGLHSRPVLIQLPAYASDVGDDRGDISRAKSENPLVGVIDLLSMELLRFEGVAGEQIVRIPLDAAKHAPVFAEAISARSALVELISSLDVQLLDRILELDDTEAAIERLPVSEIIHALRRLTLQGEVCPVLCGSAAANIGVQPLLDAVHMYLPSPSDRPPVDGIIAPGTPHAQPVHVALNDRSTTALAFKVVWDKRKGPITFVRVYSGTLQSSMTLLNTTVHRKERISRLLLPYADQYVDVPSLQAGMIGVVLGLKDTRTGDTLVDARHGAGASKGAWNTLRLRRVHVPPPVFSVSVEARTKAEEGVVADALRMLARTDPSLHVSEGGSGASSAQTVLSGMGELHLDIAKHRLENEFNVYPHLGHVRVGYRETIAQDSHAEATHLFDQDMNGRRASVGLRIRVRPTVAEASKNEVVVDLGESPDFTYESGHALSQVLRQGAHAALLRGPLSGFPMQGVHVTLDRIQAEGPDMCPPAAVRLAVSQALRHALGHGSRTKPSDMVHGHTKLMEPMMHVSIEAPANYAGKLTSDISVEQHGSILDMGQATDDAPPPADLNSSYEVYIPSDHNFDGFVDDNTANISASMQQRPMRIEAHIPLARMMRYSTRLRALTGGAGSYQMTLSGFAIVAPDRERELLRELGRLPAHI